LKIQTKSIIYILITSTLVALLYNWINPEGIELIKTERVLEYAEDSTDTFLQTDQKNETKADNESNTVMDEAKAITLKKAYELYNNNAMFIDARDFVEFEIGRIKNAKSLPYVEFDKYKSVLHNIPYNTPIVTYCDGKDCDLSIHLGDKIFEMGYKEVYIFFGGWIDWQMAGYPTEADE
jgi:rhodanese-related sulfurtransferase